jgi:hypothetical protein
MFLAIHSKITLNHKSQLICTWITTVVWVLKKCSLVEIYRRFGETCCLYFQNRPILYSDKESTAFLGTIGTFVQDNLTSYPRRRQPCNHRQGELTSPSIQPYLLFLLFVFSGLVTGHVSDIEAICVRCCLSSLQALNTQSHNKAAPSHRPLVNGSVFILNSVVMGMSVRVPVQFTPRQTRASTRNFRCYILYSFKYFVQFKLHRIENLLKNSTD